MIDDNSTLQHAGDCMLVIYVTKPFLHMVCVCVRARLSEDLLMHPHILLSL